MKIQFTHADLKNILVMNKMKNQNQNQTHKEMNRSGALCPFYHWWLHGDEPTTTSGRKKKEVERGQMRTWWAERGKERQQEATGDWLGHER